MWSCFCLSEPASLPHTIQTNTTFPVLPGKMFSTEQGLHATALLKLIPRLVCLELAAQHSTLKSPAPLISTRSSTCSTPTTPPPSNEPPGSEAQPGPAPPFPAPGVVGRQRPAAGRGSRGRALRKAGGALGLRAAWAGRRSVAGSRFADGKPCELRLCLALRVQHVNVGLLSFMVRACRFASVRSVWREWRERYVGAS